MLVLHHLSAIELWKGAKGDRGERSRSPSLLTTEEFGDGQTIPQGLVGPPGPPGPPGKKVDISILVYFY